MNPDESQLIREITIKANTRILAGAPKEESLSNDDIWVTLRSSVKSSIAVATSELADHPASGAMAYPVVLKLRESIERTRKNASVANGRDFKVVEYAIAEACEVQATLLALFPDEEIKVESLSLGVHEIAIGKHARYLILLTLQAQACVIAQEIYTLLLVGLTSGAHARCRTLYEAVIFTILISNDFNCALSDRIQGAAASEYQKYLAALGVESGEAEPKAVHKEFEDVNEEIRQYQNIFGSLARTYEWARPAFPSKKPHERIKFSDLEDHVGAKYMRAKHMAMHWDVHVTPSSIVRAIDFSSDELVQSTGAANKGLTRELCGIIVAWLADISYLSLKAVCWLTENYDDMYAVANLVALDGDYNSLGY